ncbi:Di-trans-poly-cis-decaprenylcistransferase [Obba rivulosa]|uniref:Alkyl transferase n=1 Tax=Obba rivulosa TaxID=1052685 RepID=A0A8E2DM45_9APHY|nr:Di-trans-poly-cis-decaprenylcistransferase [Obba rivulosa]
MDGNRRYARSKNKLVKHGHSDGFLALKRVLAICFRLNVKCVSTYGFAIDNFKRSPEEVEALMDLIEEKLLEICEHGDLLEQYGVRLNVVGNTALFPERVRAAAHKAEAISRHNDKAILNLCMPYASSDEMTTAVQSAIRNGLAAGEYRDITVDDIDSQLMTTLGGSPPLDVLIRTSGVKRLSDFLLWQCCENTQLQFSPTYWPDFGLWDFLPMLLDYQRKAWAA